MVNVRQSDIARELNISRVTVSKALRDHPDISVAMKKKIEATARKMGYVPNLIARQLNARRTFTLGICVPDLENSFFSYIIDSMIDYATGRNYYVILTVSRENQAIERKNIENLLGMRVDGLLVCLSQETTDKSVFKAVEKMRIPTVFFDRSFDNMKFPVVAFADRQGAINAINKVVAGGYSKIAHFAGFSSTSVGRERRVGYQEALIINKIPVRKEWIKENGFEVKDGYDSFRKLYAGGDLPEVIFTVNDRVALGAYRAAKEAGLSIPQDIGIFGYGFKETTDYFDPPLTVINQDPRRLAVEAISLLIEEIENSGKKKRKADKIFLDEEFIQGKSLLLNTKKHKK